MGGSFHRDVSVQQAEQEGKGDGDPLHPVWPCDSYGGTGAGAIDCGSILRERQNEEDDDAGYGRCGIERVRAN